MVLCLYFCDKVKIIKEYMKIIKVMIIVAPQANNIYGKFFSIIKKIKCNKSLITKTTIIILWNIKNFEGVSKKYNI